MNGKSEIQRALEELGHDPGPGERGCVSLRISGDSQDIWNLAWDVARTAPHMDQEAPTIYNAVGELILTWRDKFFDEDEDEDEDEGEKDSPDDNFARFCEQASDSQLREIVRKESASSRTSDAAIARAVARGRGLDV